MSNQPFSFPPPPPPPPKRMTDNPYGQNTTVFHTRGSYRGAGFHRGAGRGGRGFYGNAHHAPYDGRNHYANNPSGDSRWNRHAGLNPPQKRDHTGAFTNTQQARPRPTAAAPAVPSFNASIEHLLPRKPTPQPAAPNVEKPKKQNILGLTPANADPDSEPEDDEGEETRLASQTKSAGQGLEIEYRGHVSTLRTPAEIAAWIAERKNRYPTQVKVEAAKKEAAEKKRKWEEEKAARLEASRQARLKRDEERRQQQQIARAQKEAEEKRRTESRDAKLDPATIAQLKAERLRKKAQKAEERLAKAEEALRVAQEKRAALDGSQDDQQPFEAAAANDKQPSELEDVDIASDADSTDPDATSSSGTSTTDSDTDSEASSGAESDSDSAPEVISTKQAALVHDLTQQRPKVARLDAPRLCNNFAKYGRCRYGSRCRFSHDSSKGKKISSKKSVSSSSLSNTRRKGLFEVMVKKEEEEERKRLLEAIIRLGERGVLDEPGPT